MADIGRIRLFTGAMRSGLYIQGSGRLHWLTGSTSPSALPGTWCCLGVMGDVARRYGLEIEHSTRCHCEAIGESVSFADTRVLEWYGIPDDCFGDVYLVGDAGTKVLASSLNDGGRSFADIADAFDRTFKTEEVRDDLAD